MDRLGVAVLGPLSKQGHAPRGEHGKSVPAEILRSKMNRSTPSRMHRERGQHAKLSSARLKLSISPTGLSQSSTWPRGGRFHHTRLCHPRFEA
jgi:hypothetical protein